MRTLHQAGALRVGLGDVRCRARLPATGLTQSSVGKWSRASAVLRGGTLLRGQSAKISWRELRWTAGAGDSSEHGYRLKKLPGPRTPSRAARQCERFYARPDVTASQQRMLWHRRTSLRSEAYWRRSTLQLPYPMSFHARITSVAADRPAGSCSWRRTAPPSGIQH